ncbi:hypothetical protein Poli38472_004583 [Pythium oligandrum]|uniref:Uncharacterized protein n=1 Tax=Pythium oligandrum TaxID=41045 RepID=A0A8K1CA31_PYTOL|nr:hypothetical protein Poli38472_004583 [Pythium oligandrum]|eukprot:TMW59514.1 hypothetical protein Poli38472_004583 [Pythium oligandrum]
MDTRVWHVGSRTASQSVASPSVSPVPSPRTQPWSLNHLRLLYMLSRFAMYPSSTDDEEKWLRNLPLLVLVYEAIVSNVLDYDYSPVCTNIVKNGRSRRIWMNISQDARAAIDDLREYHLINALKTCSEDFQPSTAFQVTPAAMRLLASFSAEEKKKIDAFLMPTASGDRVFRPAKSGMIMFDNSLLTVTFDVDDGLFRFVHSDGSVTISKVTDVEAVSYVSSPYLPLCLLAHEATFSSNAPQVAKCKEGVSGIKDKLSFAVVLSNVRVMVGEWIPFGRNQIVTLNDILGSLERCQGGLFTSELDAHPTETTLQIEPCLTKIAIVDFEFDSFTNFEADIHVPEAEGIVQIESFGMHLNGDGTIIYGMYIDAIMDQSADSIYVDHLSRLLVDVDLDSSKIINDLLSPHQRDLMDMLFMEDARSRNKFSLITASEIKPKLPVREYLDRGERENELKQILGEIHSAYDLSEDDKIIIGREGMLLLGPNANHHEPLIVAHLALLSRELFIRFFFKRTFILDDMLNQARTYMKEFEKNPEALGAMRKKVNRCAHDLILLEEILELLRDSMRSLQLPKCPLDSAGCLLYDQLQLKKTHTDLEIRCKDLAKLLRGFRAKLKQVQSQNGNMAKMLLETIVLGVERNLGVMAETTGQVERSNAAGFDLLLVLFTGFLAYDLIERITDGKLIGIDRDKIPGMEWAREQFATHVLEYPALWFAVDSTWMLTVAFVLNAFIAFMIHRMMKTETARVVINKRINIAALERFLRGKTIESRTANFHQDTKVVKVIWIEKLSSGPIAKWRGGFQWSFARPLRTQVVFDLVNRHLLNGTFQGGIGLNAKQLQDHLMRDLQDCGCFDKQYTPPMINKKQTRPGTTRHDVLMRIRTRGRGSSVHPSQ